MRAIKAVALVGIYLLLTCACAVNAAQPVSGQAERQREYEQLRQQWNNPIELYGIVLDERNAPAAGVTVTLRCTDLSEARVSRYTRQTGPDGKFALTGVRGRYVEVRIAKEGYYVSDANRILFSFQRGDPNDFIPNPNSPVIFRIHRRSQTAATLTVKESRLQFLRSGDVIGFDVSTGTVVTNGGSLRFQMEWLDPNDQTHHWWKVTISAPDGGIIEAGPEFNFEAPIQGYRPTFVWVNRVGTDDSEMYWEKEFYFKLPNGTFGKVWVDAKAGTFRGPGRFRLKSFLNTSGGRKLE